MHGVFDLPAGEQVPQTALISRAGKWARRNLAFLAIVVAPSLLTAAYFYLLAADQYQSEAHFVVRTADASPGPSVGVGQLLGIGGAVSQSRSDALSVNDYLSSQELVDRLGRRLDLETMFRRPEADILSRMADSAPPEAKLKYLRKRVDVVFSEESGITSLKVRSFRPQDSRDILEAMLKLGEERVNLLNARTDRDGLKSARSQLVEAEQGLMSVQERLTHFRRAGADIDPTTTGRAQIGLVSTLEASLSQARSQLAAMRGIITPSSPQYVALAARVRALEGQVAAQGSKMTEGGQAIATNMGGYENLQIRQQFAAKRYENAAANLERKRDQVARQQLYIIRVVDPNLPVRSEFPQRGRIVITVFFSLFVAYGIIWLTFAGIREHAL